MVTTPPSQLLQGSHALRGRYNQTQQGLNIPHGVLDVLNNVMQGRLVLPHSVAVDDCADALYVADLEGRAVRRFSTRGTDAGKLTGSWDVSGWGKPYSVERGPYG